MKEITEIEQLHLDARDQRVAAVHASIEAARVARELQETEGLIETDGVKLDRVAKEKADLEEAQRLNVIEPFTVDVNNSQVALIADKVNEIVAYLNERDGSKPLPKTIKE